MLGGGLEPPCLAAYAPQTYVSAISPPERVEHRNGKAGATACKSVWLGSDLVDFDEPVARPTFGAFENRRVAAGRD